MLNYVRQKLNRIQKIIDKPYKHYYGGYLDHANEIKYIVTINVIKDI